LNLSKNVSGKSDKEKEKEKEALKKKEKEKPATIKCHSYLYSNIKGEKESITRENYDLFKDYTKISYDEFKNVVSHQNYNNYTHLIQFPPNFQILTPKPISFDLIHQLIQYPDLTEKAKKKESGFLGKALGFVFGKK